MGRLCETDGLTDVQTEILKTVRAFVEERSSRSRPSSSTATSTPPRSSRG